jgi:hypothetical protein
MMYMELKTLPQRLQPPTPQHHHHSGGVGSLEAMHHFFGPASARSETPAQALQFIIADARAFSRRYKALVLAALERPESVVPISTLPPLARWSSASSSPRLSFTSASAEAASTAVSAVHDAAVVSSSSPSTAPVASKAAAARRSGHLRHPKVTPAAAAAGAAVGVSGSEMAAAGTVLTRRREVRDKRQARREAREARQAAAAAAAPRPGSVGTPASTLRKWIGALVVTAVALQAPSVLGGAAAAAPFLL